MNNAYKYFIVAVMVSQFAVAESMLDRAWERLEKTKVAVSLYPETVAAYALGATGELIALGVTQFVINKSIPRTLCPLTLPVYAAAYGINTAVLMEDIFSNLGLLNGPAYVNTYIQPFNPISRFSSLIYYCAESLVKKVGIEQVLAISTEPLIDIRSSYEQGKQDAVLVSKLVSSAVLFKGLYEKFSQNPEPRRAEEFTRKEQFDKFMSSLSKKDKNLLTDNIEPAEQMEAIVQTLDLAQGQTRDLYSLRNAAEAIARIPVAERQDAIAHAQALAKSYNLGLDKLTYLAQKIAEIPTTERRDAIAQAQILAKSYNLGFHNLIHLAQKIAEIPRAERQNVIDHARVLAQGRFLSNDDLAGTLQSISGIPMDERKDVITHAQALLQRHHIKVDGLAVLFQSISGIPLTERKDVIDSLQSLIQNRYATNDDLAGTLRSISGIPMDERPNVIDHAQALIQGYMVFGNGLAAVVLGISGIPVTERRNVIDHARALFQGRMVDEDGLAAVVLGISRIPADQRERVCHAISNLVQGRQGNLEDIVSLFCAVGDTEGLERRIVGALLPLQADASIADLTRAILRQAPTENPADALQVHRAASREMKPIYHDLAAELQDRDILSEKATLKQLSDWITNADLTDFAEPETQVQYRQKLTALLKQLSGWITNADLTDLVKPETQVQYRQKLTALLKHENFKSALRADFSDLDATRHITGSELLRMVVTSCLDKPERILQLLHQGLYDAITAYVDNAAKLDQVSCFTGIAERFILCLRTVVSTEDIASAMGADADYQGLLSMGLTAKNAWLADYAKVENKVENIEALKTRLKAHLEAIKARILAQAKAKYGDKRAVKAYEMRFGKEAVTDDFDEEQLKKIWAAIEGKASVPFEISHFGKKHKNSN